MAKKEFTFSSPPVSVMDAYNAMLGGENEGERIHLIAIEELVEYPNQPFKPYINSRLQELADDISANGVLSPLLIRKHESSYQILAGRNRKNAAILAGLAKVPCIIKDVTEDEAALILVNTNLNQRDELLFSEKAHAYKIQLEAIKKQGERTDLSSCQLGTRLESADSSSCQVGTKSAGEEVATSNNESKRQIHRYIRLTYLKTELLDMVDAKTLPFMVGVALSYLSDVQQNTLINFLGMHDIEKVSLKQAEQLKGLADLNDESLEQIFGLVPVFAKPVKRTWKKTTAVIEKIFTDVDMSDDEISQIIEEALAGYIK